MDDFTLMAERLFLGSTIVDSEGNSNWRVLANSCIPEWFSVPHHKRLANVVRKLASKKVTPTLDAINAELGGAIGEVGGWDYLRELAAMPPSRSADAVEGYAFRVYENYSLNAVKSRALSLLEETPNILSPGSADTYIAKWKAITDGLDLSAKNTFTMDEIDELGDVSTLGVPTGFRQIDALLSMSGYPVGEYSVFMAPRGVGKTVFMTCSFLNAILCGRSAIYVTCEISPQILRSRMMRMLTGYERPPAYEAAKKDWYKQLDRLKAAPGRIVHATGEFRHYDTLSSRLHGMQSREPAELIVLDYIQLLKLGRGKNVNRVEDLDHVGLMIKDDAEEMKAAFLIGAQNSGQMKDQTADDMEVKWCRAIEEHAALIMAAKRQKGGTDGETDFSITKNRYGDDTVQPDIRFDRSRLMFVEGI